MLPGGRRYTGSITRPRGATGATRASLLLRLPTGTLRQAQRLRHGATVAPFRLPTLAGVAPAAPTGISMAQAQRPGAQCAPTQRAQPSSGAAPQGDNP
jgi:hypothetical protein